MAGPDLEANTLWRRVPYAVLSRLARWVWGLRVSGLEHVPREGPVILAGNHVHVVDGPLLVIAAGPARAAWPLAKAELYGVPLLGAFLRRAGSIPLERARGDVGAMRAALGLLERGGCVMIFPEGMRSKTGKRLPAKGGLGFLAGRSRAPVVPARMVRTDRFPWARGLEVRFGPPMFYEGDPEDRLSCRAFGESLLDRVFAL